MKSFAFLLFLTHLPLNHAFLEAIRSQFTIKSSGLAVSKSRFGSVPVTPSSSNLLDSSLGSTHLPTGLPVDSKIPKVSNDPPIPKPLSLDKEEPLSSHRFSTDVNGPPNKNRVHLPNDLAHTTPSEIQDHDNAISIYQRLVKLSEPAPPPPPESTYRQTLSKSWQTITNPTELAHLLTNSRQYFSSTAKWVKDTIAGVESPEVRITPLMSQKEASILNNKLQSVHRGHVYPGINDDIINKYYEAYSLSNKKSTALMEFNPSTYKSLHKWEEKNTILYSAVRAFMIDVLPPFEFARRARVIELQAEQFRIFEGWESAIRTISEQTGHKLKVVADFGDKLGGKGIFTAFKNHNLQKDINFRENLAELKSLAEQHTELETAWKNFLKSDYDSRFGLLETLSKLKHPDVVSSEKVSAWLAQGLDVKKMLKIVDYIEESFKNVPKDAPEARTLLSLNFKDTQDLYQVSKSILPHNGLTPWPASLSHELLELNVDQADRYKNLRAAWKLQETRNLSSFKKRLGQQQATLLGQQQEQQNPYKIMKNQPWWKSLASKARKWIIYFRSFFPASGKLKQSRFSR